MLWMSFWYYRNGSGCNCNGILLCSTDRRMSSLLWANNCSTCAHFYQIPWYLMKEITIFCQMMMKLILLSSKWDFPHCHCISKSREIRGIFFGYRNRWRRQSIEVGSNIDEISWKIQLITGKPVWFDFKIITNFSIHFIDLYLESKYSKKGQE